jgi:hypothetical protein
MKCIRRVWVLTVVATMCMLCAVPWSSRGQSTDPRSLQYWASFFGSDTRIGSTIAVVDTGCDRGIDPSLDAALIDGYDAVTGQNEYSDLDPKKHGSRIAGMIVSSVGIATQGRLLIVRIAARNKDGSVVILPNGEAAVDIEAAASGIRWAVDHGALVINCSWNGPPPGVLLDSAVSYANESRVLIVGAEGNEGENRDNNPGSWEVPYPNVIRVAMANRNLTLESNSALGNWVDLAVRVEDDRVDGVLAVGSTSTNFVTQPPGTSAAAAICSAISGLLRDKLPSEEVFPRLIKTVKRASAVLPVWSGGTLDIQHALDLSQPANPPQDQVTATVRLKKMGRKLIVSGIESVSQTGPPTAFRIHVNANLLLVIGPGDDLSYQVIRGSFRPGDLFVLQSSLGGDLMVNL